MASVEDPWGLRTSDWAELQEPFNRPLYTSALDMAGVGPGTRVLDAACGAGLALGLAEEMGGEPHGFDRSEAMLAYARDRLPRADLRQGDLLDAPFEDAMFDVVTSFNGVQFADDPTRAVAEMRRVAKDESHVVIAVWRAPEYNDMRDVIDLVRELLPPPEDAPPSNPGSREGPFALSGDGELEALVSNAGMRVEVGPHVACPFRYPDLEAALRGISSAGPFAAAIELLGEERVRDALTPVIEQFKRADGEYRLHNQFRYVVGHT